MLETPRSTSWLQFGSISDGVSLRVEANIPEMIGVMAEGCLATHCWHPSMTFVHQVILCTTTCDETFMCRCSEMFDPFSNVIIDCCNTSRRGARP